MRKRTPLFLLIWLAGIFLTFESDVLDYFGLSGVARFPIFIVLILVLSVLVLVDIPKVLKTAKDRYFGGSK